MSKIIAFGEVLWDLLPSGAKVGGAPLNVALHLRRQGVDAHIISKIGEDELGSELIEFLKQHQLDELLIAVDEELPTSTVQVTLDEGGHAQYEIVEPVAWDNISIKAHAIADVEQADALIYGTLAARGKATREALHTYLDNARYKVLDVNLRPPHYQASTVLKLIEAAELVKMNEEELELVADWINAEISTLEGRMHSIADHFGSETILVTLGADGAACLAGGKFFRHPGYTIEVVDTVGSGDAFLASFLAAKLQLLPVKECLNRACATGAFVATQAGANPAYDFAEIERIMASGS